MSKPLVIVAVTLPDELRAQVVAACDVIDLPPGKTPADVLDAGQAQRVCAVLCSIPTRIDGAVLDCLPKLGIISNVAVGFDNIDIPLATDRGIVVCNTPKVLDGAVADLTFGLILCVGRGLVGGDAFVRSGAWERGAAPLTHDVRGKTLGLLGMGRIGRVVARTAQAFDMKVIYHNRSRDTQAEADKLAQYRERDALFEESDFLSVHIPLNPQTRHSVGERELGLMKSSAYLINTARGPVVDEAALVAALQSGRLAGAGLDVMEQEPLPPSSPLCALPNVVLQAHVGSATVETRRAMAELACRNLLDALAQRRPAAMVNPEVWDKQAGR
jgi:glyoxylate reductase